MVGTQSIFINWEEGAEEGGLYLVNEEGQVK